MYCLPSSLNSSGQNKPANGSETKNDKTVNINETPTAMIIDKVKAVLAFLISLLPNKLATTIEPPVPIANHGD